MESVVQLKMADAVKKKCPFQVATRVDGCYDKFFLGPCIAAECMAWREGAEEMEECDFCDGRGALESRSGVVEKCIKCEGQKTMPTNRKMGFCSFTVIPPQIG